MAKISWKYKGCSAQRVPSLSNVAMRSAGGTKSGEPFLVTLDTKSSMDCLVLPSLHDGSRSADCVTVVVKASAQKSAAAMMFCLRGIFMTVFLLPLEYV